MNESQMNIGGARSRDHAASFQSVPPRRRLARCLSTLLTPCLTVAAISSFAAPVAPLPIRAPQSQVVTNCNDQGNGSLRNAVAQAQPGDLIDLSALQCSVITLTSEIEVMQSDIYLKGPGRSALKVSGAGASRVFNHQGTGTFVIDGITIADGHYHAASNAFGGCVKSNGIAWISDAAIQNCKVEGDAGHVSGGGVSAERVVLNFSTISGNEVVAPSNDNVVGGGGVSSRSAGVAAFYSSIVGNSVAAGSLSAGGGIYCQGNASFGLYAYASTLSGNSAPDASAIYAHTGSNDAIYLSTISDNTSSSSAVHETGVRLMVANSTIAFNQMSDLNGAAVEIFAPELETHSSIIANNTTGNNAGSDIYLPAGTTWTGTNNLVIASIPAAPAGVVTVTTDPQLGPLQSNGGFTKTRALLANSPAIGVGDNVKPFSTDQRGAGYPRWSGPNQAIDIGAIQFDAIFVDFFD